MDTDAIRLKIVGLIKEFKANYEQYKKELEANTETKLIEPLFAILGWAGGYVLHIFEIISSKDNKIMQLSI